MALPVAGGVLVLDQLSKFLIERTFCATPGISVASFPVFSADLQYGSRVQPFARCRRLATWIPVGGQHRSHDLAGCVDSPPDLRGTAVAVATCVNPGRCRWQLGRPSVHGRGNGLYRAALPRLALADLQLG